MKRSLMFAAVFAGMGLGFAASAQPAAPSTPPAKAPAAATPAADLRAVAAKLETDFAEMPSVGKTTGFVGIVVNGGSNTPDASQDMSVVALRIAAMLNNSSLKKKVSFIREGKVGAPTTTTPSIDHPTVTFNLTIDLTGKTADSYQLSAKLTTIKPIEQVYESNFDVKALTWETGATKKN